MSYRLLNSFASLFQGHAYRHRKSNLGDGVAMEFYEDLYDINRSPKYRARIDSALSVLNQKNLRQGVKARRGDGTLGESLPRIAAVKDPDYHVQRGHIATIEIGVEVKILAKAMIKQIDRVINDLEKQVKAFKTHRGDAISVGIVGINNAPFYTSFEGAVHWKTDGSATYKHPCQEATAAEKRLIDLAKPVFDEFLILRFSATNEAPYSFSWVSQGLTEKEFAAALVRVSREYQKRF